MVLPSSGETWGSSTAPEERMSLRPVLIHSCFDQVIGQLRPATCRCKYRISLADARLYVKQGKASWLIVDYKNSVPVESWNLVWGREAEKNEDQETRGSYAKQTPRVQTIEKAHMERAYLDGKKADIDRINVWGELAQEVLASLIITEFGDDPFEGRAVLYLIGFDQRASAGKTVNVDEMKLDISMQMRYNPLVE